MAAKKVGTLIKEARTKEGFTQAQLANKVPGLTAADIGKAERGEKELTQEQLKAIAGALGVTQKSLLDAAKGTSSKPASAKKPASSKPASSGKTASSSGVRLTAAEKNLLTLYRKADEDTKKAAMQLLEKGVEETGNLLTSLLSGGNGNNNNNNQSSGAGSLLGSLLGGGSNQSSGNAGASLLGALLGGGNSSQSSGNAGTNILGSLLGGVLGKREMPEGEEE